MKQPTNGDYVIRVTPKSFDIGFSAEKYREAVSAPPHGLNTLVAVEVLQSDFFPEDFTYEVIRTSTDEVVVSGDKEDLYAHAAPRYLVMPIKSDPNQED
jgi:hypothetical protein